MKKWFFFVLCLFVALSSLSAPKPAEEAFKILAHIPYNLIVLDSELPGLCGIDFVRILQNSREWRTIRVAVITSPDSPSFASSGRGVWGISSQEIKVGGRSF